MVDKRINEILLTHHITYVNIKKSVVGFTNDVYFIDNKYVVKVCILPDKFYKLQKEALFYENSKNLTFIPHFIAYGETEKYNYIILEFLEGVSLYSVWHKLIEKERMQYIKQASVLLKELHKQDYSFMLLSHKPDYWQNFMYRAFTKNMVILEEQGIINAKKIMQHSEKIKLLFAQQKLALVHNDLHFDNLLITSTGLKLIDFDRLMLASQDYELLILHYMCDNPKKFASIKDEIYAKPEDYIIVTKTLQKHYKQLYAFKHLQERLFVYRLLYDLKQMFESNKIIKNNIELQHKIEQFLEQLKF